VSHFHILRKINAALLNIAIAIWLNMVFNAAMTKEIDRALIKSLGGPAQVAELLSLPKYGGVQRVQNWLQRGIPSKVKVDNPHLFMPELAQALANTAQAATETIAA
jgi:hypothetical protein